MPKQTFQIQILEPPKEGHLQRAEQKRLQSPKEGKFQERACTHGTNSTARGGPITRGATQQGFFFFFFCKHSECLRKLRKSASIHTNNRRLRNEYKAVFKKKPSNFFLEGNFAYPSLAIPG